LLQSRANYDREKFCGTGPPGVNVKKRLSSSLTLGANIVHRRPFIQVSLTSL
jgi:hypothetical protein